MSAKPTLILDGMYGIGDNLHQRALIRELMKTHEVWLHSCHFTLYHDLVEQGLKVLYKGTRLRAQARTVSQEYHLFHRQPPPTNASYYKVWYNKPDIDKHGSILESMLGELGYKILKPDFSLPIHPEWAETADLLLQRLKPTKPILILRQLVLRREWDGSKRNPDPRVYQQIYDTVRQDYWSLSIADLAPGQEWIEGPELKTHAQIHDGSLTFGAMAALYARASLVLSPAGHGPVLAQATGTPCITVYGGRESFRTTERAGAHLAPTLGIDPDRPCDCHSNSHNCDKRTAIEPALERVKAFLMELKQPPQLKVLIFATTWADCQERQKLTAQWLELHSTINPEADILIVDSKAPLPPLQEAELKTFEPYAPGKRTKRAYYCFPDNVGHLSRGGKDGWGRAFCFGLDAAIDGAYDYVVHIEGDLLFRLPVQPIVQEMRKTNTKVISSPVRGMKRDFPNWCETGLMFFDTGFLTQSNFTERYNWKIRRVAPTPEVVVKELLGQNLSLVPWKVFRGDKQQITRGNIISLDLDGVTHCHEDIWVYDRFVEHNLAKHKANKPPPPRPTTMPPLPTPPTPPTPTPARKINLGCGTNKLPGWENYDSETDITKPLPWEDATADSIFAEHVTEHISYHQAVKFFEEAYRVLKPGGTIRITVPSLEKIAQCKEADYYKFTAQWGGEATRKGAMRAIIFSHGHQQCWTSSLMRVTLDYAGFTDLKEYAPGLSDNPDLRGLEGHHKVIGRKFNDIESMAFEGTKPGKTTAEVILLPTKLRAAIVLGGAECWKGDFDKALELCAQVSTEPTVFMVNDQMEDYAGPGIGATLHPQKLPEWLAQRAKRQYSPPFQVWAHRKDNSLVTHVTQDWTGSSGLFAVKVALVELKFDRVILCGIPMSSEESHYKRKQPWSACHTFRRGWEMHANDIKDHVRSFSGWTQERFGTPTPEFLTEQPESIRRSA